jgi:hypothetical protein
LTTALPKLYNSIVDFYNSQPGGEPMKDARYTEKLVLQVPPHVGETIDKVAARKMQRRSEYIRAAIAAALERDGVSLVAA